MSIARRQAIFWFGGLALFFAMLWLLSGVMLPFAAGFAIAYFLHPLAGRFERFGLTRGLASMVALFLFLLVLVLIVLLALPIFETQILELIGKLPDLVAEVRREAETGMQLAQQRLSPEDFARLRDAVGGKLADVFTWLGEVIRRVLTGGFALANLLSLVFVTPVVTFFLLRDWDKIVADCDKWLPRQHVEVIREQARLIDRTLAAFLRGQFTLCLVLGVYYAIALSITGLQFGLVIGLLVGLLAFIPYLGVATGFTLSIMLALTQFADWKHVGYVVLVFVIGQLTESNYLSPQLVGERVHLHPVWVIFALLAFGTLFGFIGVLIAVPFAAVIGVLVRFGIKCYLASPLYDPAGAGPAGTEG